MEIVSYGASPSIRGNHFQNLRSIYEAVVPLLQVYLTTCAQHAAESSYDATGAAQHLAIWGEGPPDWPVAYRCPAIAHHPRFARNRRGCTLSGPTRKIISAKKNESSITRTVACPHESGSSEPSCKRGGRLPPRRPCIRESHSSRPRCRRGAGLRQRW